MQCDQNKHIQVRAWITVIHTGAMLSSLLSDVDDCIGGWVFAGISGEASRSFTANGCVLCVFVGTLC